MEIGLVHIDGKLPNLALMKISAWHKENGNNVVLLSAKDVLLGQNLFKKFDKYYGAIVFTENIKTAKELHKLGVEIGGTGWNIESKLPDEVEKMKPDYDLYDIDYGIGFTARGCIRQCSFCVVPKKEGAIREVAMPSELVNPKTKNITILDNNFLASPMWREKSQEIIDNGYKVDFCQGLDIRLIKDENASYLAQIKHQKQIHFAFDDVKMEPVVRQGIELLDKAGIKPYRLMFYVLVNFNSTIEEDLKRINILQEYGADPFIMVYNKKMASKKHVWLANWCNQPSARKSCKFEEFTNNARKFKKELAIQNIGEYKII